MQEIRIYSPEGEAAEAVQALAPLPQSLRGQRIAVLDNGKPNAAALLRDAAEQLVARRGASFVGVFRKGSAATPCEDALFDEIVAAADLVMTGTAD